MLGKYKIEKKIGEGSFGVVYKCKIMNTDTHVAIKVINLLAAKQNFKISEQDLMKEITLLKELKSD